MHNFRFRQHFELTLIVFFLLAFVRLIKVILRLATRTQYKLSVAPAYTHIHLNTSASHKNFQNEKSFHRYTILHMRVTLISHFDTYTCIEYAQFSYYFSFALFLSHVFFYSIRLYRRRKVDHKYNCIYRVRSER